MSTTGYEELIELIQLLENTVPLSQKEIEGIERNFSKSIETMVVKGIDFGEASNAHAVYRLPEKEFNDHIKSIANDLKALTAKYQYFFSTRLQSSFSSVPPYFPDRICVLLRKNKELDLERRFLAAHFRHYWLPEGSSKDTKLGIRAKKIGIAIPSIPCNSAFFRMNERKEGERLGIYNLSYDIDIVKGTHDQISVSFMCLQCGSGIVSVNDGEDEDLLARCKACGTSFGYWPNVQKLIQLSLRNHSAVLEGRIGDEKASNEKAT